MGTEADHVFVTEFPTQAVSAVGKAIISGNYSLALAFPIIKTAEFGLSLVASEGLAAAAPEAEPLTEEQVGNMLCAAADAHEGGFSAGSTEGRAALPWNIILPILVQILAKLLAGKTPTES